ncbi:hypothetical protein SKAU_G00077480 [Synaphobranchus kaupii]|uniref:SGNH hydrolase-type esterase domain-containing protein n=1 Tax=Synaphobranchus kaupii TaxID=118154 RepID=A0A9Q1G7Z2_SYNKA|nr:hypothetical protein SKAU_G00077480 [Synaphobranchus kaupii]
MSISYQPASPIADEEQLFPGRTVTKVWCPTTKSAVEIFAEPDFGTASHIIVHTGTNDLRAQQERVAGSVRRVAGRAAEAFPSSKIIISTLLPRRDFHPFTIHRVTAEISHGFALIPNVYLAHHTPPSYLTTYMTTSICTSKLWRSSQTP